MPVMEGCLIRVREDGVLVLLELEPWQAHGSKVKGPDQGAAQSPVDRGGQKAFVLMMPACRRRQLT